MNINININNFELCRFLKKGVLVFLFTVLKCQKFQPFNPLTPEDFHVFEWFSAFTRPIGFRDSIFKVTIENAAVLKH